MSRAGGGPLLDPPRLGPSLGQLGFALARRRRARRRISVWLRPGSARPRRGRRQRQVERHAGHRQANDRHSVPHAHKKVQRREQSPAHPSECSIRRAYAAKNLLHGGRSSG
jgi:hypothetical protein